MLVTTKDYGDLILVYDAFSDNFVGYIEDPDFLKERMPDPKTLVKSLIESPPIPR